MLKMIVSNISWTFVLFFLQNGVDLFLRIETGSDREFPDDSAHHTREGSERIHWKCSTWEHQEYIVSCIIFLQTWLVENFLPQHRSFNIHPLVRISNIYFFLFAWIYSLTWLKPNIHPTPIEICNNPSGAKLDLLVHNAVHRQRWHCPHLQNHPFHNRYVFQLQRDYHKKNHS